MRALGFFVVLIALLSGCSTINKPASGQRGGSSPRSDSPETMRDMPAVHKATMRPYQIDGKWYYPTQVQVGDQSQGIASWYGPGFDGKKTSNGEIYNMYSHTAAHKTFPMNTMVRVVNRQNNKTTIVRINDRGPFVEGRVIDLSNAAAKDIDMYQKGTAPVLLEVVGFSGIISSDVAKTMPKEMLAPKEYVVGKVEKSVEIGRFAVQIGAFRSKEGAERFRKENDNTSGYRAGLKEYQLDGKPIYRVMLGGFKGEEEARDFIAKKKLQGAFIITE